MNYAIEIFVNNFICRFRNLPVPSLPNTAMGSDILHPSESHNRHGDDLGCKVGCHSDDLKC
jgi:hypothetical protein